MRGGWNRAGSARRKGGSRGLCPSEGTREGVPLNVAEKYPMVHDEKVDREERL